MTPGGASLIRFTTWSIRVQKSVSFRFARYGTLDLLLHVTFGTHILYRHLALNGEWTWGRSLYFRHGLAAHILWLGTTGGW